MCSSSGEEENTVTHSLKHLSVDQGIKIYIFSDF